MTFTDSFKTCFIRKYANFKGRASRSEFWWFYLACAIISFIIGIIEGLTHSQLTIITLIYLLPQLGAAVRRIHDSNHNGWWVICPIVNIIMCILPGTPYPNDYGPVPLDTPEEE